MARPGTESTGTAVLIPALEFRTILLGVGRGLGIRQCERGHGRCRSRCRETLALQRAQHTLSSKGAKEETEPRDCCTILCDSSIHILSDSLSVLSRLADRDLSPGSDASGGRHIRARAAACPANGQVSGHSIRALHGIRVDLNVFGYRSIQSGQFIYNPGTLIQILARFFNPDTVKTGHCHL